MSSMSKGGRDASGWVVRDPKGPSLAQGLLAKVLFPNVTFVMEGFTITNLHTWQGSPDSLLTDHCVYSSCRPWGNSWKIRVKNCLWAFILCYPNARSCENEHGRADRFSDQMIENSAVWNWVEDSMSMPWTKTAWTEHVIMSCWIGPYVAQGQYQRKDGRRRWLQNFINVSARPALHNGVL